MEKQEVLKIAKDVILKAGVYKNDYNEKQKNELMKLFSDYKKLLINDTDEYSKTVLSYIIDLMDDLENNRELNIDTLDYDDIIEQYIENYLDTANQVLIINKLVIKENYKSFFVEANNDKSADFSILQNNLDIIISNFEALSKSLNSKIIAKNLLIFTLIEKDNISNLLERLYFFSEYFSLKLEGIINCINFYKIFIQEIREYGAVFIDNSDFNSKFIVINKNKFDINLQQGIVVQDASILKNRSGFKKYEYMQILKLL